MASFASATLDASSLKLAAVRKEVDLLKYQLEQIERNNDEPTKELSFSKEAH